MTERRITWSVPTTLSYFVCSLPSGEEDRVQSFGIVSIATFLFVGAVACTSHSSPEHWETLANVPPVPTTPIRDYQIIPGHRIGPIALGMTPTQLYEAMRDPKQTVKLVNATIYEFPELNVWVLQSTEKVHLIGANSRRFATPEGLHDGDSELAARAAYPNAQWKTDAEGHSRYCDARGMQISTYNGVVSGILVQAPGC